MPGNSRPGDIRGAPRLVNATGFRVDIETFTSPLEGEVDGSLLANCRASNDAKFYAAHPFPPPSRGGGSAKGESAAFALSGLLRRRGLALADVVELLLQ